MVTQIYVANEKFCQLAQGVNDIVGLIKPYDPCQQPHMWFVDNGEKEGFVPSQALTPYTQHGGNLNLIDLDDEDKKKEKEKEVEAVGKGVESAAVGMLIDLSASNQPEEMVCLFSN